MNPSHAYKDQRHVGWSRIEMLLTLYDAAIMRIETLRKESGDRKRRQLDALRLLLELRSGLNMDLGEIPQRVDQLLEFVQHCVLEADDKLLDSAIDVLGTLRAGFDGIREEAIRLEADGQIPSTDVTPYIQRHA
jgi:flagellin-specific chaperone FliS